MCATEALPIGFSLSKPAGAWESKEASCPSACLDACSEGSFLYAMMSNKDGVFACSCANDADMDALTQYYPTEAGQYEVLYIGDMQVGAVLTVQYDNGMQVTSTNLPNNYCSFTAKLPGKIDILLSE